MKSTHYVLKLELLRVVHEPGEKSTPQNNYKSTDPVNEDITLIRVAFTEKELNAVLAKGTTVLDLYAGE